MNQSATLSVPAALNPPKPPSKPLEVPPPTNSNVDDKGISDFSEKIEESRKKNAKQKEEKIETRGRHEKNCKCGRCKASLSAAPEGAGPSETPSAAPSGPAFSPPKELPTPDPLIVDQFSPTVKKMLENWGAKVSRDPDFKVDPEQAKNMTVSSLQIGQYYLGEYLPKFTPVQLAALSLGLGFMSITYEAYSKRVLTPVKPPPEIKVEQKVETKVTEEKINPAKEARQNRDINDMLNNSAAMAG